MMRKLEVTFAMAVLALAVSQTALAKTFAMPENGDSLIDSNKGRPLYVKAKQEDTLIDIAVRYLLGQEEIVVANKNVDRWLPGAGTQVLIPSTYLLPDAPRQGVVINLPEYRMYYYVPATGSSPVITPPPAIPNPTPISGSNAGLIRAPVIKNKTSKLPPLDLSPSPSLLPATVPVSLPPQQVISYAVGIGRVDWKTPLGTTKIVAKVKNPTWTPPATIKAEHLAKGDPLPDVIPSGPDNPLGLFAFRLGIPGYLLHSTNRPEGIGMQISHGCMRLYPKDVEQLFGKLEVGTPVTIVNQPIKVGWSKGVLYIESHPNLEGEESSFQQRLEMAQALIQKATANQYVAVDNLALKMALEENNGIPMPISGSDPYIAPFGSAQDEATPPPATAKKLPQLETGAIPLDQIQEELRQERQEREFKNSPFPY